MCDLKSNHTVTQLVTCKRGGGKFLPCRIAVMTGQNTSCSVSLNESH